MTEAVITYAEIVAAAIEFVGISLILLLSVYAVLLGGVRLVRHKDAESAYETIRQRLGREILLGLEFLVAADIIHTVAVELTFTTVGTLAVIVIVRTFLSFTLHVELTGRWPWERGPSPVGGGAG